MMGPLRSASVAYFALAWAATSPSAAQSVVPDVLCLVNPQPIPGDSPSQWQQTLDVLKRDAERVCQALGGRVESFDRQLLLTRLKQLGPDRPRIVFYAGHGKRDPKTNQVSWPAEGGDIPLSEVLRAIDPGAGPDRPWSTLIMNSCESAYADLRGIEGRVSVIGSGWGKVSAEPNRLDDPESLTRFGESLLAGIAGAADVLPEGNCDGVVTDGELSRTIGAALARAARKDSRLWHVAPVAALRRNGTAELPLLRLGALALACRNQAPSGSMDTETVRGLPRPLRERVETGHQLRGGFRPRDLPPLVAVISPTEADEIVRSLESMAGPAGLEIVRVSDTNLVASVARMAAVPVYWLNIQTAGRDSWYVELVRGRDRASAWASFLPRPSSVVDTVSRIAARLPNAWRIVRPLGHADGQLRTTLVWNNGAIEWMDWKALAEGKTSWRREDLKNLRPAACPDFAGVCFELLAKPAGDLEPAVIRRVSP
jgi:hypothetical protein